MPNASEVIESCLIEETNLGRCSQTADAVIGYLNAAGYLIITKDLVEHAAKLLEHYPCVANALDELSESQRF
ncbi:hypothetical protein [Bradyrhizobium icense]|uniref:hypothetical protein n=1 Tax=Bradyrhizobium icense TaxID=1274631 RepID=UPI0012EA6A01|nr:hypothetical protein [Bradyrhizobium icense]